MSTQDQPDPRSAGVIDAADEPWIRVERVLEDALRWVRRGEVIDVLTTDRTLHDQLVAWCTERGHHLLAVDGAQGSIRVRIGRGETTLTRRSHDETPDPVGGAGHSPTSAAVLDADGNRRRRHPDDDGLARRPAR